MTEGRWSVHFSCWIFAQSKRSLISLTRLRLAWQGITLQTNRSVKGCGIANGQAILKWFWLIAIFNKCSSVTNFCYVEILDSFVTPPCSAILFFVHDSDKLLLYGLLFLPQIELLGEGFC